MKRYGYIVEQIATYENLSNSFDYEVRGKVKRSSQGRWLLEHRDEVIREFQKQILDGTWELGKVHHKTINERGKIRDIDFISIKNGIALHAIMVVVEKYLDRTFIADTAASIKGRGGLYLINRIRKARREDPSGTQWIYKADIRKYYENIRQDLVMEDLRRIFKDAKLLSILERCVRALESGMSIGLRSSQSLANMFLSIRLDHILKDRMREKHHFRYCDDTVGMADTTRNATRYIREYRQCVHDAGLDVKGNEQLYRLSDRPLDFLGYRVFGSGKTEIRKHIKQRFARRWHRVRSKRRKRELMGSFYGIAKHANAKHLFKTITRRDMKNFADFGFEYHSPDGKKDFNVSKYRLAELVNRQIVVEDFEKGLKTAQGDDRYLVLFSMEDGRKGKFWTASGKMKQALDYIFEKGLMPFTTIIQSEGNYGYLFT